MVILWHDLEGEHNSKRWSAGSNDKGTGQKKQDKGPIENKIHVYLAFYLLNWIDYTLTTAL